MKIGKSLKALAEEITRRANANKDNLVATAITAITDPGHPTFSKNVVVLSDFAQSKIVERLARLLCPTRADSGC